MGCSVIQRGIVSKTGSSNAVVFQGSGVSITFDDIKVEEVAVDDTIFCAYRDDGEDPPFSVSGMGYGSEIDTLDGAPEVLGGGGDTWYEIEVDNGSEIVNVSANQLLPAKLIGWADVAAKDLTTSMQVLVVNFAMANAFLAMTITAITSSTSTVTLNHPIFDGPATSTYYAAADSGHSGDYGILVATCLGGF